MTFVPLKPRDPSLQGLLGSRGRGRVGWAHDYASPAQVPAEVFNISLDVGLSGFRVVRQWSVGALGSSRFCPLEVLIQLSGLSTLIWYG